MKTHKRALMELSTRFWALHPEKLEQVSSFVAAELAGEKAPAAAGEVFDGGRELREYEVRDGVAILPMTGVMDRRMNLFQAISGGVSSQQLAVRIREAGEDPEVEGLLLDIDSPGGSVFAVEEIAEAIREVKAVKPVIAHSYGMCCSAAYWAGSQCTRLIIGGNSEVGSIGVVYVHYDQSEKDKTAGVHRTVLTAGKYKRIAADNAPLSREGEHYVQEQLDTYYSLFVDAVAEGRGVSTEKVLTDMAEGRTFIGEQALKAGLVDEIGNLESALAQARGERRESSMPKSDTAPKASTAPTPMTAEALTAQYPDAVAAVQASAVAAERERVMEIYETEASPELTATALRDGTDAKDFMRMALRAQKTEQHEAEASLAASLDASAGQDGKEKDSETRPGFMEVARDYARQHDCSMTRALNAVARQNPKLHKDFLHSLEGQHGDV